MGTRERHSYQSGARSSCSTAVGAIAVKAGWRAMARLQITLRILAFTGTTGCMASSCGLRMLPLRRATSAA